MPLPATRPVILPSMARFFNDGASEYLERGSLVWGTTPLSVSFWFNTDDLTIGECVWSIADSSSEIHRHFIVVKGNVAGDYLAARSQAGGSIYEALTSVGVIANTWNHGLAVYAAPNDRRIYLNGGAKGTDSNSVSPSGLDTTAIGRLCDSTPSSYWSGGLAAIVMWAAELTDLDAQRLASGEAPWEIQPARIRGIWLVGTPRTLGDRDASGRGEHMTAYNTPSWGAGPRGLRYSYWPAMDMSPMSWERGRVGSTVVPPAGEARFYFTTMGSGVDALTPYTGVMMDDDGGARIDGVLIKNGLVDGVDVSAVGTPDLDDIGDVDAASPVEGDVIVYDPDTTYYGGEAGVIDIKWHIDGALATSTEVGGVYVATGPTKIKAVYIHCKTLGTASSTIVDVHSSEAGSPGSPVTIFTTQANRPTLPYNDADLYAVSGTPEEPYLDTGDFIRVDIDQVATGAAGLTVIVHMVRVHSIT